jgi:hypothetical protein
VRGVLPELLASYLLTVLGMTINVSERARRFPSRGELVVVAARKF